MNPNNDPVLAWHIRRIREIGDELREARARCEHLEAALAHMAKLLVLAVRP